jgi:SNF2 family DNA or RNA helicase
VAKLQASARSSAGGLEIVFKSADGGVLSADRAVAAWRKGSELIAFDDGGGWALLPKVWLREHIEALERILEASNSADRLPPRLLPEVNDICAALGVDVPDYFSRLREGLADIERIPDAPLPSDLSAELRPYQRLGVNWINFLHLHGLGALVADDMGLGKTLQTLCAIRGRTLVICPTSVISSWSEQCARFRPGVSLAVYHGARRALSKESQITVTSYGLLRMDIATLSEVEWDTVVLDEAQMIRNPRSQVAQAASRLKAVNKVALSGTPVENSLEDLWSQCSFLNPGLLGSYRAFQERFAEPIAAGNIDRGLELRRKVAPFILRRMKGEVARDLPPKTEVVIECELNEQERPVYEALLGSAIGELRGIVSRGEGALSALEALLRLRQACCHRGLLPGMDADSSSKVELLIDYLIRSKANGHRALVFSQWTALLDKIEPHLKSNDLSFVRIDGSTADRGSVVDSFQSDDGADLMLLSLKAGGVGLTLTAADHVYIVDPWWNPAVEDQAADRAYRIGQRNPVIVHRLVAKDTVEERILKLQESKRGLLSAALGAGGSASLSPSEILKLIES